MTDVLVLSVPPRPASPRGTPIILSWTRTTDDGSFRTTEDGQLRTLEPLLSAQRLDFRDKANSRFIPAIGGL